MAVYKSVTELIGKTPLFEPVRLEQKRQAKATVLAKLEYFNPAGSAKDRVAAAMIERAEEEGRLVPGSVIIEPTSGNTGIGLASVASAKGYEVILTMPDTMSVERQSLLKAYGARVVLTPGEKGMAGAIEKAAELASSMERAFVPGQFTNPSNPEAHYATTGPEIWEDTDGNVDIFVAGVGTGGTLTGVGKYLKAQNGEVKVVAVEPAGSPLLSRGLSGPHGLQGIGANFIPEILDTSLYDEVIAVGEEEAYATAREFAAAEGILVGITSGAALHAAFLLAAKPENAGKTIVAMLPDTGERYLSTPLFSRPEE